jgi:hypothetical protein
MAESLLPLQITANRGKPIATEVVSSGKSRKIISHECGWAFHYQFFVAGAFWKLRSHIYFGLKVLFSEN